ncbi:MAG: DoxX family protein [Haloferacaceae archaeon]
MSYQVETDVLGDHVSLNFDGPWAGYWLAFSRIVVGYWFLHAGLTKILFGFSAKGYLQYASAGAITEPILKAFASGAGLAFVNVMIPAGEFLIGLGLIVGAFLRLASFFGALLMSFFFFTNHGWAHGMVSSELLGLLWFITLAVFGAGRVWGVDEWLEQMDWARNNRWANYLLG